MTELELLQQIERWLAEIHGSVFSISEAVSLILQFNINMMLPIIFNMIFTFCIAIYAVLGFIKRKR